MYITLKCFIYIFFLIHCSLKFQKIIILFTCFHVFFDGYEVNCDQIVSKSLCLGCLNSQFYMVEETKATAQNHQPATNSSQTL